MNRIDFRPASRSASRSVSRVDTDTAAGLLARLGMALRVAFARRSAQPSRLAIDALPDELARLTPGGLYVVYAIPRRPGCDALIWESAREARTRHVTVVLARTREETAARMRELGFVVGTPARGWPRNLNVLAMPAPVAQSTGDMTQADAGSQPETHAPAFARLVGGLRALKRFGLRSNSLYFIEGAENWFSWRDPAVLAREGQLLADWCAARKITLVLVLHPTPGERLEQDDDAIAREERFDDESYQGRSELHGACAGVARLRRTHGELLWYVDFWRAGQALVTGEVHSLRFTENGRLTIAPETLAAPGAKTGAMLARDEDRVIATRAVVVNEAWVPGEWDIVEDLQGALAACDGAVAATVLLDYVDQSGLEPLCSAVHGLRRQCGRALKIVVVERSQALRHQYELLLSSLGANLLLGRDVPFSRLQSLLLSLQGQVDTRPIADDYRASLAAALTDAVLGYLPVDAFCWRVRVVLRRGAMLQLPHVLAKLTLLPEVSHVDALRSCMPRRAGDVLTCDAGHIYVFLFACRMPDADTALARIFETPVERWSDSVVFLAGQSIDREAKALAEANRRAPAADYSDLFAELSARAVPEKEAGATPPQGEAQAQGGTLAVAEAASQLMDVERALASVDGHSAAERSGQRYDDAPLRPLPAPRRRYAEPCAMPLRATEEN